MFENNDKIMVSICCITYNQEKYIAEAIESFLMQKTNFKYEILIHDDASTDNTVKIIKSYEEKYPELIKPIYQKENQYSQGKSPLENLYGIAQGKYIAICEGDDYWIDKDKLQIQFDYMEKNPDCGGCFHGGECRSARTGKKNNTITPYKEDKVLTPNETIPGGGGLVPTNSIFCKAELLKNFPEFYKGRSVEDYQIQIHISANKYAYYMSKIMSVYRVEVPGSWTMSVKQNTKEERIAGINKVKNILREFNKYSNGMYSKAVNSSIRWLEFEEEVIINKKINKIKEEKYREVYNKMKKKEKIKIYLEYYFPNLNIIIKNIYKFIKSLKG